MDLIKAIAGHRAVRDYTAAAVNETTIRTVIDAAVRAPNALNSQPWTFLVVRDQKLLDQISVDAKVHMLETLSAEPDARHFRAVLEDLGFHIFYHAPVLILISAIADDPWFIEDCSLAAENLMLSAHGSGLGSCWIGFAQRYLNTPNGKTALGLPACCVPVAPVVIGHPTQPTQAVPREEPVIRWIG